MKLNDDPVRDRLRALGAADHVVRAGAEGLVERWRAFVEEAEGGYPFGLDDYRNELDIRSLIEETDLGKLVEREDQRMKGLLIHTDRPVWESEAAEAFWVWGYPRNASGELLQDLQAEGLIEDLKK
jgi:hypothetical protein